MLGSASGWLCGVLRLIHPQGWQVEGDVYDWPRDP